MTTYDQNHWLFTMGGTTVAGHEAWQVGLRFGTPVDVPAPLFESALGHISMTDIWNAASTWFGTTTVGVRYDTHTKLTFVRLAAIGEDGNYLYDAIEATGSRAGTVNATNTTPPQLSVVVSLWSGSRIGHANRGRYFLPVPNDWVNSVEPSTGMVIAAHADALRTSQVALLQAIEGEIATTEVPSVLSVFSPVTPKSVHVTEPSHKPVESLGVGRTVDTQRSRRTSLPEGLTTWSPF